MSPKKGRSVGIDEEERMAKIWWKLLRYHPLEAEPAGDNRNAEKTL